MRVTYPETRQSRVEIDEIKEKPNSNNLSMTSRPRFWLMLIVGCLILIVILFFVSRII